MARSHARTPRVLRTAVPIAASLVLALCSCALQKKKTAAESGAAATPTPTPAPSPTPAPIPEPTPQSTYRITVSTEDGEQQETVITPGQQSAPSPTPANEVTVKLPAAPTPRPSPTPKGNLFTDTLRKIFPPKSKPPEGAVKVKPRGEGFFSRMWHKVFPPKKRPPVAEPPLWIGAVKLVNERDGYALIDTQGFVAPPPGQIIHTIGNESETATLRISEDRTPPFFIADILSGKPSAGDRVYSPNP